VLHNSSKGKRIKSLKKVMPMTLLGIARMPMTLLGIARMPMTLLGIARMSMTLQPVALFLETFKDREKLLQSSVRFFCELLDGLRSVGGIALRQTVLQNKNHIRSVERHARCVYLAYSLCFPEIVSKLCSPLVFSVSFQNGISLEIVKGEITSAFDADVIMNPTDSFMNGGEQVCCSCLPLRAHLCDCCFSPVFRFCCFLIIYHCREKVRGWTFCQIYPLQNLQL
jgi:hypothetical protein